MQSRRWIWTVRRQIWTAKCLQAYRLCLILHAIESVYGEITKKDLIRDLCAIAENGAQKDIKYTACAVINASRREAKNRLGVTRPTTQKEDNFLTTEIYLKICWTQSIEKNVSLPIKNKHIYADNGDYVSSRTFSDQESTSSENVVTEEQNSIDSTSRLMLVKISRS